VPKLATAHARDARPRHAVPPPLSSAVAARPLRAHQHRPAVPLLAPASQRRAMAAVATSRVEPWLPPDPHAEPPYELAPTSTNPPGALPTSYGTSPNCQTAAPATSLPEQNPPPPPKPPARRAPFPGSPPPKPTLGMGCSRLADAHRPTHRRPPSPEHRCTPRRAPPLTAPAVGASPITSDPDRAHHQVALASLMLLHSSLAASKPSHGRNRRSPFTPPLFSRPGTPDSNRKNSRVFSVKSVTHMNSVAKGCFAIIG
jgi:hypothetical protein